MAIYDQGFENQLTGRLVPQNPAIPGAIVGSALAIGGGGAGTGSNGNTTYICVNSNQKVQYGSLTPAGVLTWGAEVDLPGVPVPVGDFNTQTDGLKNSYFVAKIANGTGIPVVIWSQILDHVSEASNKQSPLQKNPNVSQHRIIVKVFTATSLTANFASVYQPTDDCIIAPTNAQWLAGSTPLSIENAIAASWGTALFNRQAPTYDGTTLVTPERRFEGFVISPSNTPYIIAFDRLGTLVTNAVAATWAKYQTSFVPAGQWITAACYYAGFVWVTLSGGNKLYKWNISQGTTPAGNTNWVAVTLPTQGFWSGIAAGPNSGDPLIVTMSGASYVYESTNVGSTWVQVNLPSNFYPMQGVGYVRLTSSTGRFVIMGSTISNKEYINSSITRAFP